MELRRRQNDGIRQLKLILLPQRNASLCNIL